MTWSVKCLLCIHVRSEYRHLQSSVGEVETRQSLELMGRCTEIASSRLSARSWLKEQGGVWLKRILLLTWTYMHVYTWTYVYTHTFYYPSGFWYILFLAFINFWDLEHQNLLLLFSQRTRLVLFVLRLESRSPVFLQVTGSQALCFSRCHVSVLLCSVEELLGKTVQVGSTFMHIVDCKWVLLHIWSFFTLWINFVK